MGIEAEATGLATSADADTKSWVAPRAERPLPSQPSGLVRLIETDSDSKGLIRDLPLEDATNRLLEVRFEERRDLETSAEVGRDELTQSEPLIQRELG